MRCDHDEPRQTRDTVRTTTLAYQYTETRVGNGPDGGKEEPHRVYKTAPPAFGGEVSVVSRYESTGKRQVLRVEVFDASQQPLTEEQVRLLKECRPDLFWPENFATEPFYRMRRALMAMEEAVESLEHAVHGDTYAGKHQV